MLSCLTFLSLVIFATLAEVQASPFVGRLAKTGVPESVVPLSTRPNSSETAPPRSVETPNSVDVATEATGVATSSTCAVIRSEMRYR